MKFFYQYMAIFLQPTSSHLYPLQVQNCNSNSILVVDGDGNGKFKLEKVHALISTIVIFHLFYYAIKSLFIEYEMCV